jgi:hypothetical protein
MVPGVAAGSIPRHDNGIYVDGRMRDERMCLGVFGNSDTITAGRRLPQGPNLGLGHENDGASEWRAAGAPQVLVVVVQPFEPQIHRA